MLKVMTIKGKLHKVYTAAKTDAMLFGWLMMNDATTKVKP